MELEGFFDASDITFWDGGDSVGVGAPLSISLEDPCTVEIVLGQSPSIVSGYSRVAVAPSSDVIFDLAGNRPYLPTSPSQADYCLVIAEDITAPVVDLLTVNALPTPVNGQGAAGGSISVPRYNFDLSMCYSDSGGLRSGSEHGANLERRNSPLQWIGSSSTHGPHSVSHGGYRGRRRG